MEHMLVGDVYAWECVQVRNRRVRSTKGMRIIHGITSLSVIASNPSQPVNFVREHASSMYRSWHRDADKCDWGETNARNATPYARQYAAGFVNTKIKYCTHSTVV